MSPDTMRLAASPLGSAPVGTDESSHVREVATAFLRVRPVIVAPFFTATVAVMAAFGAPRPQVVVLGLGGSAVVGLFVLERANARKGPVAASAFARSLVATLVGIALACAGTGGLGSPMVPMLFAPLGIGFAAFGRSRIQNTLHAVFAVLVAVLFAVTGLTAHLAIGDVPRRVVLAMALLASALLLRVGVAGLTAAHARAADTVSLAGDELVRGAEARARDLESLGSRVAHEVKNPLSAVRALVEVMLESADERAKRRLTVAAQEVARIQTIVEGYAAASRPLDVVTTNPVDVVELVGTLGALLSARASRVGVELVVEAPRNDSVLLFSLDRHRVHEALLNLVLNAIDATAGRPDTSPRRVRLSFDAGPDGLTIVVEDSGKGMDANTLSKVGTPFFSRREGGTGLGVLHARQVIERHGGTLVYESQEGRGTKALARFPAPSFTASEPTRS